MNNERCFGCAQLFVQRCGRQKEKCVILTRIQTLNLQTLDSSFGLSGSDLWWRHKKGVRSFLSWQPPPLLGSPFLGHFAVKKKKKENNWINDTATRRQRCLPHFHRLFYISKCIFILHDPPYWGAKTKTLQAYVLIFSLLLFCHAPAHARKLSCQRVPSVSLFCVSLFFFPLFFFLTGDSHF